MADTRIPIFNADAQTAYIDYRTEATNLDGRQVIVVGDPSVNAAVAEVASVDPGASSTLYGQVVRVAGSIQVGGFSGSAYLTGIYNSVAVHVVGTGGTLGVRVGQVDGSIAVHLVGTGGTMAVNVGKVDGTVAVYLHSTGGTLGVNVGKIEGTSAIFLQGTGGTIGVRVGQVDGSIAVHLVGTGGTLGVRVGQVDGSIAVHLVGTGGSLAVKIDPSYNVVNAAHTIILTRTVSGSTSGVSASGVQLVAPDSGNAIKVCGYSIQTTGAVSMAIKFTNGAGTSPTEYWRPLVTASGVTGVQGANLVVTPPGYIFATAANTTLAIVNDSASLIHYSVAYFKESA